MADSDYTPDETLVEALAKAIRDAQVNPATRNPEVYARILCESHRLVSLKGWWVGVDWASDYLEKERARARAEVLEEVRALAEGYSFVASDADGRTEVVEAEDIFKLLDRLSSEGADDA